MVNPLPSLEKPSAEELRHMDAVYRKGGQERHIAPHIVYGDAGCPYPGCEQKLQALDFCLVMYGPTIHDPLVRAWWDDTGFAGRCPSCGGWIHFTIHGKQAISAEEAAGLPKLPDDWNDNAVIL
jgi:hypothetical protein